MPGKAQKISINICTTKKRVRRIDIMGKKILIAALAIALLGVLGLAYADDTGAVSDQIACTHYYSDYPGAPESAEDTVCTVDPQTDYVRCMVAGAEQDYILPYIVGEETDYVRCMVAGAEQDFIRAIIAGAEQLG